MSDGKTDVVVSYEDGTTCAIETIMAKRTQVSFDGLFNKRYINVNF